MTEITGGGRIPQEVIDQAESRDIGAVALDLGARWPREIVNDKGTACPGCGGVDRFSVNRDKNLFFCRMSGAGGGPIALVRHVHGCNFREAVEHLTGKAALPPRDAPEKDEFYREAARKRAYAIWRSGRPAGDLIEAYFGRRGLPFPDWRLPVIRQSGQLAYWHWSKADQRFRAIYAGPAMLAAITGPDGHFMGVHRTWIDLSRRNGKAEIIDPETGEVLESKKVEGSQRGGVVVLRDAPDGRPALWSALNLGNLAGRAADSVIHPGKIIRDSLGRERRAKVEGPEPLPGDDRCLPVPAGRFSAALLLGDGDSDRFTTQAAMIRARKRFGIAGMAAEVDFAPDGQDFNDALNDGVRRSWPDEFGSGVVIGEGIETVLARAAMAEAGQSWTKTSIDTRSNAAASPMPASSAPPSARAFQPAS